MDEMKLKDVNSPEIIVETGDTGSMHYDAAEVRQHLCAVSSLNEKGNLCWFDGDQ